jgi:anti-sigma factor RsiW
MKRRDNEELLKSALQRKLTSEEEAQLESYWAAHPEEQARWEEDLNLSQLLRQLPDAPLASNFTAQVLRLTERQLSNDRARPTEGRPWFFFGWLRVGGLAASVFLAGFLFYHQYRTSVRKEVAQSVATVFGVMSDLTPRPSATAERPAINTAEIVFPPLPTLQMLEDFEAIKRLSLVPHEVDVELLAALDPSLR